MSRTSWETSLNGMERVSISKIESYAQAVTQFFAWCEKHRIRAKNRQLLPVQWMPSVVHSHRFMCIMLPTSSLASRLSRICISCFRVSALRRATKSRDRHFAFCPVTANAPGKTWPLGTCPESDPRPIRVSRPFQKP
jgi:hypothetical protein